MATKKRKKKNQRKAKNLIFVLGITAVIFVVATYAWFIGLSEVKINTFNVEIKASDGLQLSLNGRTWTTAINLGGSTKAILDNVLNGTAITDDSDPALAYVGNTNTWLGITSEAYTDLKDTITEDNAIEYISELVPLSTEGEINTDGTLKFYTKTSMTASRGGYSLRANELDRVDDETGEAVPEERGYIAFDLFVKNKVTGGTYNGHFNQLNDEAVYLTTESGIGLLSGSTGSDGLQNSLRVAFLQLGRVSQNSEASAFTGITCATGSGITKLCNMANDPSASDPDAESHTGKVDVDASRGITYNIWEPNDLIHTTQSVNKFKTQCKNRETTGAYGTTACTEFGTSDYVKTYVVNNQITSADNVDIYDGHNGYTAKVNEYDETDGYSNPSGALLKEMVYYTDTKKNQDDGLRPQIFSVASSSITKFRIYIFLEGQDVDNFDISSDDGDAFQVSIGFTKDRFATGTVEPEPDPGE